MDPKELAQEFLAAPSAAALDKIVALVKENPQAAVAIVGILGVSYIAKLGLESLKK